MIFRTGKDELGIDLLTEYFELDANGNLDDGILEDLLDESTWNNTANLEKHYRNHVLKDGEEFNSSDPKFSSDMTLDDYRREAEQLTIEPAGTHDDKTSKVIGFKLKPVRYDDTVRSPRYVKIKRYVEPEYFTDAARGDGNRYREAVIYVDNNGDNEIISYMIIKPSRFMQYVKYFFDKELPENS